MKSRTLNFVDRLLELGRARLEQHRVKDAARIFSHLVRNRSISSSVLAEAHYHLAKIHLQEGNPRKARRSLAAALAIEPSQAEYYHLLALAFEDDEKQSRTEKALDCYRQAAKFDPKNAEYFADYGNCALDHGYAEEGLKALRRAARLAPDDTEILGSLTGGLHDLGEDKEAHAALRLALFQHPRDSRFRTLWNDYQFQVLHDRQQDEQPKSHRLANTRPVILPFVAASSATCAEPTAKILRCDPPEQNSPNRPTSRRRQTR